MAVFFFVHAFSALASKTMNAVCIHKQIKKQRNTMEPLALGRADDFIE
jgi:hypothetical protein